MDMLTHLEQKATKLVRATETEEPSFRKARSHCFSTCFVFVFFPFKWETLQNPMKTAMKSVLRKPCIFCRGRCCLLPPPLQVTSVCLCMIIQARLPSYPWVGARLFQRHKGNCENQVVRERLSLVLQAFQVSLHLPACCPTRSVRRHKPRFLR